MCVLPRQGVFGIQRIKDGIHLKARMVAFLSRTDGFVSPFPYPFVFITQRVGQGASVYIIPLYLHGLGVQRRRKNEINGRRLAFHIPFLSFAGLLVFECGSRCMDTEASHWQAEHCKLAHDGGLLRLGRYGNGSGSGWMNG